MPTIYGNPKHFDVQRCQAAAALSGTKVDVTDAAPPKGYTTRPCLIDGKTGLLGGLPISWHLSGGKLRGSGESDVLCWMNWAETQLRPAAMSWVLSATSCVATDLTAEARPNTARLLGMLNDHLLEHTFLSGERLSLADLAVAFTLLPAFEHVFEQDFVAKYQNVTRHFNTVMQQPEIAKIVGSVSFCESAQSHDAGKYKTNAQKLDAASSTSDGKGKKDKKKEKKKEEKKEEKKPAPEDEPDEVDMLLASEKKEKDPFAELPKGTFDMDAFKRCYSNEDTEKAAIPHFWEKFDAANYSIWYCKYKYPEDLTMTFMSCNLMSGMMQRLDKLRKHAFGSMCLFGTNNDSQICGLWFWRGHKLAFEMSSDWQVDYDSYTWEKLDPSDAKTKTLVHEYLMWEGKFDDVGKPFNQGKIFK